MIIYILQLDSKRRVFSLTCDSRLILNCQIKSINSQPPPSLNTAVKLKSNRDVTFLHLMRVYLWFHLMLNVSAHIWGIISLGKHKARF